MRRGARALLAIAAVAGAGGVLASRPVSDLVSERRAAQSFAAVARCVWGASPSELMRDPSDAEHRLRSVMVRAAIEDGHAAWPGRCEPYVGGFRAALEDLASRHRRRCEKGSCDQTEGARLSALRSEAGRLAELVERGESKTLDPVRLVELARDLGLDAAPGAEVPPAPEPAALLDPDGLRPLYRGDYLRLLTDPAGDESLDLLFYEHETRYGLCTVPLVGEPQARCRTLSSDIPVGFAGELFAAERGAPPRMYAQGPDGQRWQQALYDVETGRQLSSVAQRPLGGFVWRDGTMVHLGFEPPMADVSVVRVRGDVEEPPVLVDMPAHTSLGPKLVWDEIVWAEPIDGGRHRLAARRVLAGSEPLGPVRELGETMSLGDHPTLEICRTDRSLALLVVGRRHRDGAVASLVFRGERGWNEPIHVRLGAGRFGFTCQGGGATLSWIKALEEQEIEGELGASSDGEGAPVRGRYAVYRLRCTNETCERGRAVVMLTRHHRASRYVAGALGESTVVMWRSPLGDVRMRLAPLDQLPAAPEVALFDDIEHDGFGWDLERDPIFGRAGNMLVLVSRQVGTSDETATYGLVVDGEGGVTPVSIAAPTPEHGDLAL